MPGFKGVLASRAIQTCAVCDRRVTGATYVRKGGVAVIAGILGT